MRASQFLAAIAASLHEPIPVATRSRGRAVAGTVPASDGLRRKTLLGHQAATRSDLRACPPLAYDLHLRGGKCRRLGGPRVCGDCVGDLRPEEAARLTVVRQTG
jgi:hypothetical protein